jgi:hypothetical protein
MQARIPDLEDKKRIPWEWATAHLACGGGLAIQADRGKQALARRCLGR